ncbi:MAG: prepilin peptidase [Halothermotrichaceae bacterium]
MIIELLIFISGLFIGSFLNVVIYRLPQNKSIVLPGSHCPQCKTRLKAIDLIPVVSWLIYRGRCRYCQEKISLQYPLVELLTGILFLFLFIQYGFVYQYFLMLVLVSLLIISAFIDLKHNIIPNKITIPGIIIGLVCALFSIHINITSALLGMLIPSLFLFIFALFFKQGMGMGDVKLVAMIGVFLGWQYTFFSIVIGSFLGIIVMIPLMVGGVVSRKYKIPFGTFISTAAVIMIFYGKMILNLLY